jgi:branched-chain amino acid transport system substrate-binding protein
VQTRIHGSIKRLFNAILGVTLLAGVGGVVYGANAAAATTKGTIEIGILANVTGPDVVGEQLAPGAAYAWAKSVNKAGGIQGHHVKIIVEDTKGEPASGVADAQSLINNNSIDGVAVFDVFGDSAYETALRKSNLTVIGGFGVAPYWGGTPNWLVDATNYPSIVYSEALAAVPLNSTKVAMVICQGAAACTEESALGQAAVKAAAKETGKNIQWTGDYVLTSNAPDYNAQCLAMIQAHDDLILLTAAPNDNLTVAKDCHAEGYKGQFSTNSAGTSPSLLVQDDPGTTINMTFGTFPWFANAAPVKKYQQVMEAGGLTEKQWGSPYATGAYATLELLETALGNIKLPADPTRATILKALGTLKNETLGGLLPEPISFTPDKPTMSVTCWWDGSFTAGKFTASLSKTYCAPKSLLAENNA